MKVQIITAFVPLAVLITETVCLQGYGPRAAASRSKTCGCGCGGGCADSGMGRGAGGGGKNALGGGNASYLDFQQGAVDEIVIINDQEIPLLAGEYLGEPDEIVFERIVRVDEYGNEEIQIVKDEIYDIGNDNGNSPLIRYGAGNAVGNDVGVELAIEMPTQNGANIQEMIDPNGNVTITGSNGNGRIMESIDPYGNVNITESNGNQQITETIDPYGNITIAENNGNERLLETIDPYGNINITESNGGQQIMETIDPYGNINITESNGGQQIMEAIDPYGNINITENIGNERIVETIDPYGNINITESINGVEMIAERISPNGDITIIEDTVLPIVTLQDNPALASYFNELPATARTNVASPQQSINWLALAEQQTQFTPRQIINNAAEQLQYNVLASVPQAGATSYRSLPVEQVPVIVASDRGSPITTGIIRSYPGVNYVQSFLNGAVFEGTAYWYSNYLTSIGSCGYSPSTLQYGAFLIGLPLALMPEGCSQGICGSNLSPLCGLCAVVTNSAGKSIVARIVDTANTETYNIILSEPAFAQLAPVDQGMVKVSYQVAQCPVF